MPPVIAQVFRMGFLAQNARLEAWRSATDQANTAALNMLGGSKIHSAIPWFWSDQFDLTLQIAGMPELEIRRAHV